MHKKDNALKKQYRIKIVYIIFSNKCAYKNCLQKSWDTFIRISVKNEH